MGPSGYSDLLHQWWPSYLQYPQCNLSGPRGENLFADSVALIQLIHLDWTSVPRSSTLPCSNYVCRLKYLLFLQRLRKQIQRWGLWCLLTFWVLLASLYRSMTISLSVFYEWGTVLGTGDVELTAPTCACPQECNFHWSSCLWERKGSSWVTSSDLWLANYYRNGAVPTLVGDKLGGTRLPLCFELVSSGFL